VAGTGVASGLSGPTGGAERTGESLSAPTASAIQTTDDITQTHRYERLPDRPGQVRVTLTYTLPGRVGSLTTYLLDDATVTGTDGFDRIGATAYKWDESTSRPSITLQYNPNRTTDRTGPEAAGGQYVFADAGEWALLRQFRTRTGYSYRGAEPTVDRRLRTAGPGATGNRLVYLGEATTAERTRNGRTVRLVVPERADLSESPEAILDSVTNASQSLRIGDRDPEVVAFAAPTGEVEWGVRGLAYGGSEFWVRDFERLDEPANVWLHEYVHTRQAFETTAETRWLTEATAQYYAAVLTLEQGRIDFEAFRRYLAAGERSAYDDVVLSRPATWTRDANYLKGALAAGRLDLSLRSATDQSATLEQVVREMNSHGEPVNQSEFLGAVEAAGGTGPRATATEITGTSEPLSMWDRRTQTRLFGAVPARISYGLPDSGDRYRASGPARNDTVSAAPVRLATGETLTAGAVVSNTGGEAGNYNATLAVDGRVVSSASGALAAESERTVWLAHTFERAGEYALDAGGETVTVVVEPPAEPTVSDVSVDSERVRAGGSAVVTATVRNDAAIPANGTVPLTRDGETVGRRAVTLAPGASTELSATVELPDAGERRLGAGSAAPVTVTVVAPTGRATASDGSGAGFGATAAVLAALAALLARRRL